MATDYAGMASVALGKEFERLGAELLPLAERVVRSEYNTHEGREAEAVRLCELCRAVLAVIRTQHIMEDRMEH